VCALKGLGIMYPLATGLTGGFPFPVSTMIPFLVQMYPFTKPSEVRIFPETQYIQNDILQRVLNRSVV